MDKPTTTPWPKDDPGRTALPPEADQAQMDHAEDVRRYPKAVEAPFDGGVHRDGRLAREQTKRRHPFGIEHPVVDDNAAARLRRENERMQGALEYYFKPVVVYRQAVNEVRRRIVEAMGGSPGQEVQAILDELEPLLSALPRDARPVVDDELVETVSAFIEDGDWYGAANLRQKLRALLDSLAAPEQGPTTRKPWPTGLQGLARAHFEPCDHPQFSSCGGDGKADSDCPEDSTWVRSDPYLGQVRYLCDDHYRLLPSAPEQGLCPECGGIKMVDGEWPDGGNYGEVRCPVCKGTDKAASEHDEEAKLDGLVRAYTAVNAPKEGEG